MYEKDLQIRERFGYTWRIICLLVRDWAEWVLNEAEKESQLALGHPLSILDSHPTSRCQTVHKFLSGVINISEFLSRNLYKGHCLPKEMQKNDNIIVFLIVKLYVGWMRDFTFQILYEVWARILSLAWDIFTLILLLMSGYSEKATEFEAILSLVGDIFTLILLLKFG